MRTLVISIIVLSLLFASGVRVFAFCPTIEYAELKDMPTKELIGYECLYGDYWRTAMKLAEEMDANPSGSLKILENLEACTNLLGAVDRILIRRSVDPQKLKCPTAKAPR